MAYKLFLSLFLMISSLGVFVIGDGGESAGAASMPCVQKLLPCQPYLKSSSAPPSTCCLPLKQMITEDAKCLCEIFNNAQLLKNFNVTQDDALKLPKACGTDADISVCKKGAAEPTATPPTGSSTSSPTTKSAANGNSDHLGGFTFIAFLVVSIISSF
ncbi:hypothetical protein F0562_025352 [Nyssa sinensis]|uniref:Bifunctional inhibitor/plant lipid transfer protein/seed storage helical domain-containing protein n=1 Tax=Nyssa sinensis TaxID=561372 RepID=A0A5J5BFD6_9ASTE|nr:hypothetical protein F0562_025352 [Nyssa sinensis]